MQCEQIQELLKSDYLDNQASLGDEQYIREHLLQCPQCRNLEKKLQAQRSIFQKAQRSKVPERVWLNIRDAIVAERLNEEDRVSRGFLQRVRELFFQPRPVFVLTSAFTAIIFVMIVAGVMIQKRQLSSNGVVAEGITEYGISSETDGFIDSLGTSIEEYFL